MKIVKYGVEYNMQRDEMKEQYLNGEKNNFWIDGRHELYESDWKSNTLTTHLYCSRHGGICTTSVYAIPMNAVAN